MSDITMQVYRPLDDGEYQMARNSVIINGNQLIASYRGGTLTVELTDNVRLCVLETDAMPGPDWSQAPAWAQWWAVDPNGYACWYQEEPILSLTVSYSGWVAKTIQGVQIGNALWAAELDLALGVDWRVLKQPRSQQEKVCDRCGAAHPKQRDDGHVLCDQCARDREDCL